LREGGGSSQGEKGGGRTVGKGRETTDFKKFKKGEKKNRATCKMKRATIGLPDEKKTSFDLR